MVKEIGPGLNGNRRRLRRLVADHTVSTVVVEHRERLCRFGFEYVEAALAGRGARILVMDDDPGDDLARDVTEVMTSLCARLYGRRSARRRAAGRAVSPGRPESRAAAHWRDPSPRRLAGPRDPVVPDVVLGDRRRPHRAP